MNRRDFFKIVPALAVGGMAVIKALQMRRTYGLICAGESLSYRVRHIFLDGIDVLPELCQGVNDEEGWVDILGRDAQGRRARSVPRRHYGDVRVVLEDGPQMGGLVKHPGNFYPRRTLQEALKEFEKNMLL